MSDHDEQIEPVAVKLANGKIVKFQVSQAATGPQDVGMPGAYAFEQVVEALQGIVENLKETLDKVKPDKASVKFGVEMAVESGNLTAMIVKGSGKGNLEITLEWGK